VRPLVIGHRGASGTRPENTLVSFRRAAELGADMVELDVQLTRDGEVVVMHDATLERTTDGRGSVRDHSLAELRRLDAGRWFDPAYAGERVPTLAEVFEAVALAVNVELKPCGDDGLEAATLGVVEAAGALGRVVFSSFEARALQRLRALAPRAELAVLWNRGPIAGAIERARGVAARALHIRKDALAPATLAAARGAHLAVRVWTVNEPAEIGWPTVAGVDGVFSDFPERFLHDGRSS
jgi:glycerophosphoryl diester phosphodiesterase